MVTVTSVSQQRVASIDAKTCDVKQVVLGEHVFIDQMHVSLCGSRTLSITALDETRVLVGDSEVSISSASGGRGGSTYCSLSSLSLYSDEGVMDFLDMQIENVVGGEVFATLVASVCMSAIIMRLIFAVGVECQGLMGWQ